MHNKIGLARGTVRLARYDSSWPALFGAEAKALQASLGINGANIQHVGSTSIPGIVAKPIIDIAILADDLAVVEEWQALLENAGYWYKGPDPAMPDRKFFAKGPEERRTVYLHVVHEQEFKRLLKFRDALRGNESLAYEYSELKKKLAATHSNDRANYSKLKNDFIKDVLSRPA